MANAKKRDRILKRGFDLFFSFVGFFVLLIPILLLSTIATIYFWKFGLFRQDRIGRQGIPFSIYKIRTMKKGEVETSFVLENDPRITGFGKFMRSTKLDEIPQLWNVLKGDMSFVGPRPDVQGYADKLQGEDRIILSVRPGITGPATLKYKDEERILASQKDPQKYNDEVIWPDKVEINKQYVRSWSFSKDLEILWKTIFA